jgi:hypothetical protein
MLAAQKANAKGRRSHHGHHHHHHHGGGQRCFLRGTRILTPEGEVKIEDLAVGDLVSTIDGTAKPIERLGSWSFPATSAERWPGELLPIRIARSALGPMVPHTDLYVSAFHAFYIDGLLVPARNLVNGRSIVHCTSVEADTIEYFHIELEKHDVIFSEGAPTETLLADASGAVFDGLPDDPNARIAVGIGRPEPFAPIVPANRGAVIRSRLRSAVSPWIDRRQPVDAIWDRLAERAETELAA